MELKRKTQEEQNSENTKIARQGSKSPQKGPSSPEKTVECPINKSGLASPTTRIPGSPINKSGLNSPIKSESNPPTKSGLNSPSKSESKSPTKSGLNSPTKNSESNSPTIKIPKSPIHNSGLNSPTTKSGLASPTLGNNGLKPSGLGEFGGNDRTIFGVTLDQPSTLSSIVDNNKSTTFGTFGKVAEKSQSFADMLKQQTAGPKSFSDMLKSSSDQAPKSFADLLKEKSTENESVQNESEEEFGDQSLPVPLENIATGEEDETILFTSNCRLYHLNEQQQWKERGIGNLHLNQGKNFKRLVMRLEGVHRLILNVQVVKKMPCERVQEKYIRFVATEAPPKPTTFLLKFSSADKAMSLEELLI